MFHYLRRLFASQPINPRQLQRTVSGLDRHHIESGNYIYKNFIKNKLPSALDSLKLLNIYGEGTLNREPVEMVPFIDIWGGGLWTHNIAKKPHPSFQKPNHPFSHSKGCNRPPASQKNSSSLPKKSSP